MSAEPHHVISLNDPCRVNTLAFHEAGAGLAYCMGRGYGDVCLNSQGTPWVTTCFVQLIAFDDSTGRLACEAGALSKSIQRLVFRRGWMRPAAPGIQLVTVGALIANDVHGKIHHAQGSFGNPTRSIALNRTDGEIIQCGPDVRTDWYPASVSRLGLTGVILQAEIQL